MLERNAELLGIIFQQMGYKGLPPMKAEDCLTTFLTEVSGILSRGGAPLSGTIALGCAACVVRSRKPRK